MQLRKLVGFSLSFDTRGSAEATGGREGGEVDKTETSRIHGQVIQSLGPSRVNGGMEFKI